MAADNKTEQQLHQMQHPKKDQQLVANHNGFKNNPDSNAYKESCKSLFLEAYEKHGTITTACRVAGINRSTVFRWLQKDQDFRVAVQNTNQSTIDDLYESALFRAKDGDTALTIFLLKCLDPQRFGGKSDWIDPNELQRQIQDLTTKLVAALRKNIPNHCPHCKTYLGFTQNVADMLMRLSKGESA